jgi:hypothetical protein
MAVKYYLGGGGVTLLGSDNNMIIVKIEDRYVGLP